MEYLTNRMLGSFCDKTHLRKNRKEVTKPHVKLGKCEFEYCENNYKVGGTKNFDSYIYSGPVKEVSTTTTTGDD